MTHISIFPRDVVDHEFVTPVEVDPVFVGVFGTTTVPVDVDPVLVDEGFVLENITFPFQLHVSVVYCELVSYFFHVELHVSIAPDSDVFVCVCTPQ